MPRCAVWSSRSSTVLPLLLFSLDILHAKDYSVNEWYFKMWASPAPITPRFIEGTAEKQGKRLWAQRYLMLVGCRLLMLRYPPTRKQGDESLPLNVIDLTNACITRKSNTILSLFTHREVLTVLPFHVVSIPIPISRWHIKVVCGVEIWISTRYSPLRHTPRHTAKRTTSAPALSPYAARYHSLRLSWRITPRTPHHSPLHGLLNNQLHHE